MDASEWLVVSFFVGVLAIVAWFNVTEYLERRSHGHRETNTDTGSGLANYYPTDSGPRDDPEEPNPIQVPESVPAGTP